MFDFYHNYLKSQAYNETLLVDSVKYFTLIVHPN